MYRTIIWTAVLYEHATWYLMKGGIRIVGDWEHNMDEKVYN